jgi:hypothetical protein
VTTTDITTNTISELSCTTDNVVTYSASVEFEDETYTTTTDEITVATATDHNWSAWTADEGADTHTRTCQNDGCSETQTEAHQWSAWAETTPATTEADGEKTRNCPICGATETEVIPKIEGSILWAGYEQDVVDAGILDSFDAHYVYAIAKKAAGNLPSKLQIRHDSGNTYTYTRDHACVMSITDITYAGADAELWVIDRQSAIKEGDYVVVGKYTNAIGLQNVPAEEGASFTVEYPVPELDTTVYSATIETIDPDLGYIVFDGSTKQTVTIVTGVDVTKIQLKKDGSDVTMTYSESNATVTEDVLEGTPVKVWTFQRLFGIQDYTYSIYTRSQPAGLVDSEVDLTFSVKADPTPVIGEDVVVDVNDEDATVTYTITTIASATKIRFTKTGTTVTATYDETSPKVLSVVDNGDNTKTWTIKVQKSFNTAYSYDVQAKNNAMWSDAVAVNYTIGAAPEVTKLFSAEAVANDDGTVTITVVTVIEASKVKLTKNDNSTITIQRGNKLAVVTDDEGAGQTTWVITLNKTAGKTYNYTVSTNVGGEYFGSEAIEFTMPAASN